MRTRNMMASLESLEQHAAVMHAKTEHLRASRRQWDSLNARLQPKLTMSDSFAVRRPEWPGLDLDLDQVLDLSGKKKKEEKRLVSREVENFLASINERVEAKSIGLHSAAAAAAAGDTQAKRHAASVSVPSDQACHEVLENLKEEPLEEIQVEPYLPAQVAPFEEPQVHEKRVYDEPVEEAPLEFRRNSDAPAHKENQVAPLEGSQVAPSVQQFLETSISEPEPINDVHSQGDSHQEPQVLSPGPSYQPYNEEPPRPLHEEPQEEPYHKNQVEPYQEPQVEPYRESYQEPQVEAYRESLVKPYEEPELQPYQEPAQVQPFEGHQDKITYEHPQERPFEGSQEQPLEGPQEQPYEGPQERPFAQERPFEGSQEVPYEGQERPFEGAQAEPIPAYQEPEAAPLQDYQGAQEAPEQVGPGRMYEEASSESWAEPHAELEQQMADILRHAPTPNRPPPPPSKSGVSPSSSWGKIKNLSALRTRPASPSSSSSKSSSGSKRSSPNRSPSTSRSPRRANK
ncbi:uncharacterized protein LOC135936965 isoform X2 [Cloeon dipterum]